MIFKNTVDVLSSVASLIAIVSVLLAWYHSKRRPLKLKRVLVHQKKMSTRIFLYFTNRNAYPVRIKNVKCFKKVTFQVLQKNDYRPEKTQRLDYDDLVFQTPQEYEIEAFADCSVVVNLDYPVQMDLEQLVCSTQTSHGYHLLKVKNIDVVRMGTPCASYLVPFEKTFESSFRAMIYHILTVTRYYILKSFKK